MLGLLVGAQLEPQYRMKGDPASCGCWGSGLLCMALELPVSSPWVGEAGNFRMPGANASNLLPLSKLPGPSPLAEVLAS